MKIGVDLDGVVFDSEKLFRVYAELYDILELKRNSIRENREVRFQERYNWTPEEVNDFYEKYQEIIVRNANFMPGAKEVLKMLKNDGHQIVVITARGSVHKENINISKDIFKKANMEIFDDYFWGVEKKDEICVREKIDLMIEDSNKRCRDISNAGIRTIYLKDAPNFDMEENKNLKVLYNWGEVYRYIKKLNENRA